MDEHGIDVQQLYSGVWFPHNNLHMTFHYYPENGNDAPTLPKEIQKGWKWGEGKPIQEVFIYGMVALEEMTAYACYINTKRHDHQGQQYKFQHLSSTPLHITVDTGHRLMKDGTKIGISPVESGIKLKQYIKNAWMSEEPDMYGFVRFPSLMKWEGYWDIMTDEGSYYDYCMEKQLKK